MGLIKKQSLRHSAIKIWLSIVNTYIPANLMTQANPKVEWNCLMCQAKYNVQHSLVNTTVAKI
jgi:hypothetical protein